jgi:hypothetical protein
MTKLRLTEAMAHATLQTGKQMTRRDLAGILWPRGSDRSRPINLSKLMKGDTKRVDIEAVTRICKATGVDPNFLFGWEHTEEGGTR